MSKELEEGLELKLDFNKLEKAVGQSKGIIPVAVQHADTNELILVAYTNELAFRKTIETNFGFSLDGKKIILSISRLVPKKGIKEFIEEGISRINEKNKDIAFLIVGDGPQAREIDNTIRRLGFSDKVHRLGYVKHDCDLYNALFAVSDVFVMPNIKIPGDIEGF